MTKPLQTAGVNDVWSYHELLLDSSARDAGTNVAPVFHLAQPLHDVMGFQVLDIDIPLGGFCLINDGNNHVGVGVNENDFTIPNPTILTARIPPGIYTTTLALAQAVGDLYDYILERDWPGRFKVRASLDGTGHVVFSLTDRTTGAFVPPDSNSVYLISLNIHSNDTPAASPWDLQTLLGFENRSLFNLPNTVTGPNIPAPLSFPQQVFLRCNLTQRCSRQLLFDGSTARSSYLARFRWKPTEALTYRPTQTSMYLATDLDTVQTVQFDLRFETGWDTFDVTDQPWTIRLAIITQRPRSGRIRSL